MLLRVFRRLINLNNRAGVIILRPTCKFKYSSIKKILRMYNSGFSGFFGGSIQGLGQIAMHSDIINNHKVHRNHSMDNRSVNVPCPIRKVLCGKLRLQDAGSSVEICGRIQNQRLGRFLFLRDDTGITQFVVPDHRVDIQRSLRNMPLNSFLVLRGYVTARPDTSKNEKMATEDIEVLIEIFK